MSALIVLAAAAAITGNFDCQLDTPHAVSKSGSSAIEGLPSEAMKFVLDLKGSDARVDWQDSPIQLNGKQVVLPTGPESGMVIFLSGGPCMFTETACGSMFNFARQPDGSLKIIVLPSAVTTEADGKSRSPFLVLIEGRCVSRKTSK